MKQQQAAEILELLRQKGHHLATAESCTGGLVGATITSVPGSSDVYMGGFITYNDSVKNMLLGIPLDTLKQYGAVSEVVVKHMANSCKQKLQCEWGIATTGFAGPNGGNMENPVGTVWIAIAGPNGTTAEKKNFQGTRIQIQEQSVQSLLNSLLTAIGTVQNITCSFEH